MKTVIALGLAALLSLSLVPTAAYAGGDDEDCVRSENCDVDDDDDRKKPRFQTRFFSE